MDLSGGIFVMLVASLVVASICLGLIIGVLIIGRRRDRVEQRDIAKEKSASNINAPQSNETQLDRIEKRVKEATLSSTRLGVLAISVGAIIFAGTGLEMDIWLRVFVLVVGLAGIFSSRYIH